MTRRARLLAALALIGGVLACAAGVIASLSILGINTRLDIPGLSRLDQQQTIVAMMLVAFAGYLIFRGGWTLTRAVLPALHEGEPQVEVLADRD